MVKMIMYLVIGRFITIRSGKLQLNDDQARRRQHALKDLGGGLFEVMGDCGFKHGEIFGYDGPELNNKTAKQLEQIDLDGTEIHNAPDVPDEIAMEIIDLDSLDIEELRALAKKGGITVSGDMTEDDLRMSLLAVMDEDDAQDEPDAQDDDDAVDLDGMCMEELREICATMGVEFADTDNEDDLRIALLKRQEELEEENA